MTRTSGGSADVKLKLSIIRPVATEREVLCQLVSHGPLVYSDAIVCLTGHDIVPRLQATAEATGSQIVDKVVLSGGVSNPPEQLSAQDCHPKLLGMGIDPEKVIVENASQNTHEQAEACVEMALERGWGTLMLVASPYHLYRATLTFIQSLKTRDALERVRLVPLPAMARISPTEFSDWSKKPDGMDKTRLDLLHDEFRKVDDVAYHCATYKDGIEYMLRWERDPNPVADEKREG